MIIGQRTMADLNRLFECRADFLFQRDAVVVEIELTEEDNQYRDDCRAQNQQKIGNSGQNSCC